MSDRRPDHFHRAILHGIPVLFHPELPPGAHVESIELLPVTDPETCTHPHDIVRRSPDGDVVRYCPQCCRLERRGPLRLRPEEAP